MKSKNPIAVISGWLALMFGPSYTVVAADSSAASATASQQAGTIIGQVSNAATKSFLEGATVAIAGTNRVVTTDREGRYHVSGLSGEQTLEVSFAGLDPQRISVSVGAGQRVVRNV